MRAALVLGMLALAVAPASAQELPADLPPTGKTVEVEMGSLITSGDGRRMRELARTPTWLWGTARAFVPLDSPVLFGQLRLQASSDGTGRLIFDGFLRDQSHIQLRLSRSRFPFALVSRVPEPPLAEDAHALDRLEQSREQVELSYDRSLGPLGGRLDAALDFQRLAGSQPLLAAGFTSSSPLEYVFGNPAYRHGDDLDGGATVGYSVVPGGVRLRIAGGIHLDRVSERLLLRDRAGATAAGLANLHDRTRSRRLELLVSAANDRPATLIAGASYRLSHTALAPRVDDALEHTGGANGTIRSGDGDIGIFRHHFAGGTVWQPWPRLHLSARLDARRTDLDAHASQTRDLGTYEIVRADSSRDNWSLDGRLQGRYGFLSTSAVELDARGGLRRGEDDWNLRTLLGDGITSAGERIRFLDRRLLTGTAELRVTTRLLSRLRATLAAHLEGWHSNEDVDRLIDAFRLGSWDWTWVGAYLSLRARLSRRYVVDAKGTIFRNTWTGSDAKDENWRLDVRLRASATLGSLMLFALGSLTDDRHDLSGAIEAQPGFAALDFSARSWVAVGGATVTLARSAWVSATYTLVANTVDLTTRLHDAALSGSALLPWKALRLQLSARYLDFYDRAPVQVDGRAVLLLVALAGSF